MKSKISLIKIALCGPSDVNREIAIAKEVITEWNLQNGEARGFWLEHKHWSSNCHPEAGDRPQAIVNRQIIDGSDLIVAVFWNRLGTTTGVASSGTEEEIKRGVAMKKVVAVYFSDLESVTEETDKDQLERLWNFRQELRTQSLCWNFASRAQFRQLFARHLAMKINEIKGVPPDSQPVGPTQIINGNHNNQAGRDVNLYAHPPIIKNILERREGAVSPQELFQIKNWIEELAEGDTKSSRNAAFGKFGKMFLNHFRIARRDDLSSKRMPEVEEWFKTQRAIQTRGLRTKAPDQWRHKRIGAIKSTMRSMGRTKEEYYTELARRLGMKKPFDSLTSLTKTILDRVYDMVLRDARTSK